MKGCKNCFILDEENRKLQNKITELNNTIECLFEEKQQYLTTIKELLEELENKE